MLEAAFYIAGFLMVSFGFVVFFGAPYVRILKRDRQDVFKLYPLSKKDVFVDIGCGDGVLLRTASKHHARAAVGYELNPWLYGISRLLSRRHKGVIIHFGNFWSASLPPETTVVYTFLNGRYMPRLRNKLEAHVKSTGKPLYFISYGFKMPGLTAVKTRGATTLYHFQPLQT